MPVEPQGSTRLGISFRPRQVEALGLDGRSTLSALLAYPFQLVRLGAYWSRMEPRPGVFVAEELDWQVEAAERAGKQIVLCVGALKTFGYPEFFVPDHRLRHPLPEGRRIGPAAYPSLLAAATDFLARVVDRYKDRASIIAWQVEHEAVDPLGFEHSWRLDAAFVEQEVATVRRADPRPGRLACARATPGRHCRHRPLSLPRAGGRWRENDVPGRQPRALARMEPGEGVRAGPRGRAATHGHRGAGGAVGGDDHATQSSGLDDVQLPT
jgi:hypothetical protein